MTYKDQIKHPLWQKKRLEILNIHNFTCQKCNAKEKELHVHHTFYRRGALAWEYGDDELMVLCCDCHKSAHFKTNRRRSDKDELADSEYMTAEEFFAKMKILIGCDNEC